MEPSLRPLDLDAVQAFVLVADLQSFTRAAEALYTTQSAISLKLKRLEDRLGRRLLERTPRQVRLSSDGLGFLDAARALLTAHERALGRIEKSTVRLALGISDHVAGDGLPAILAQINAFDPGVVIEVRIGASRDLLAMYDRGELDAAIVRRDGERSDGELIQEERMGWFAAPQWQPRAGEPIRLATFSSNCGIRELAVRRLEDAGIPWIEVFVGGGVHAVSAAVTAGLAVTALLYRVRPAGAIDVGKRMKLPPLPLAQVMLHTNVRDSRAQGVLRTVVAAMKSGDR
ncbi:LysR family transcriptional regulator [Herbaspirillum sp. RV1423]|uniref:LysR family transcriptional regulator n=1 Tax=Herbaspirillum sp. RV1423 TaxID=1443993 RepID=UPI0004B4657F|nr:LysR family transcriptional regulator [Herbaspirillum sp. RV1423]